MVKQHDLESSTASSPDPTATSGDDTETAEADTNSDIDKLGGEGGTNGDPQPQPDPPKSY